MLRYIFKNYDNMLETVRKDISSLFNIDSKKDTIIEKTPQEIIDAEIEIQEKNLKEKDNIDIKHQIRAKTLYLRLKKMALLTTNKYIKRADRILKDEVEESAYEAIDYIKRVPNNLTNTTMLEIYLYKALLYELIEDFDEASNIYKKAIKLDNTSNSLKQYKNFVERSREVLSWHKKESEPLRESSLNLHNSVSIDKMPEVAQRLERIAEYYARSPKSRNLAKRYYKEVIKMYKKLVEHSPKKYTCDYIDALINGVEIFMLSPLLLKEAETILLNRNDCIDKKIYLLDKINELKEKSFIQKSSVFLDD